MSETRRGANGDNVVGRAQGELDIVDKTENRAVAIERAWYAGDDTALRAAWDRFGALVFTYCVRAVGDRDTAADCTQETFVSAWRSRARFDRSRGSLASWLLVIQ